MATKDTQPSIDPSESQSVTTVNGKQSYVDPRESPSAMLSTIDNPYDPFTQYDDWFAFDEQAGYHTPGLLARIAVISDESSDADQLASLIAAVDEIVDENISGMHIKVYMKHNVNQDTVTL